MGIGAPELLILLGPALFVVAFAALGISVLRRSRDPDPEARATLDRRYAAGEISYAEYRERRAHLQ